MPSAGLFCPAEYFWTWPLDLTGWGRLLIIFPLMADKHYRSIVKAISWRATGTVDTIVISYFITGHMAFAIKIGFVELFTKICLYYVHERIWEKLSFGRERKDDYSI